MSNISRSRWAAVGAAIAVTLGAGGVSIGHATTDSGEGPVSAFFPIEPCRLAANAAIPANSSITLDGWGTTGNCTLPNDITGLAANVTAVNATQQTNLRFYAQGDAVPETANLNPSPGAAPTPNAVNITLNDTNGKFRVYNRFGTVAVFIDIMGYYDNHTHDDRYYQKSEVDTAVGAKANSADVYTKTETAAVIAASSEAVTGTGISLPASLIVQRQFLAESITTPVAGQLLISKFGIMSIGCSAGGRLYFVTVDGVPLRSSVVYVGDGSLWSGQITGTTEAVIPAGAHTIGLGGQCFTPENVTGSSSTTVITSSTVTVLP